MNQQINYEIKFKTSGDQALLGTTAKLDTVMDGILGLTDKIGKSFESQVDKINKKLNTITFSAILDQVDRVANGLDSLSGPGLKLSTSMYDLQAITGVAGDKLKQIEGYARSNAKAFGGDAAASVESYKLLLSQLTPEIANTPAALDAMGRSVSVLSKGMGGDAVAATEVLTTAMNQYQVSTADPIAASKTMAEMMNIMAAAAKEGSAELPQIKGALQSAGMAAKGANVSFAETNAAIQVLDKAGKKGAEGGTALRNMLAIMGQGRFMPKDVQTALQSAGVSIATIGDNSIPLAERLKALQPIINDSALLTKIFGMENQNAARALITGIPEMERLTTAITGTNTAFEQAAIVMESPAEKAARFQAQVDDLKISMFNATGGAMGYVSAIGNMTRDITNILPLFTAMGSVISFVTSAQKMQALWTSIVSGATAVWTGAVTFLNAAFWANPLTWIIALIVALVATIAYVVYAYDGWGEAWDNLMNFLKFSWAAFKESFNLIWLNVQNDFLTGIELIEKAWFKLKSLWDEDGATAGLEKINQQQNDRAAAILESQGKMAENLTNAALSFDKIGGSLHSNGKGFGDVKNELSNKLGITPPAMPGTATPAGNNAGGNAAAAGAKTTEAIATGGSKSTNITIQIKDIVGTLNIGKNNFKESADEMHDMTVDALIRALNMAQVAAQ